MAKPRWSDRQKKLSLLAVSGFLLGLIGLGAVHNVDTRVTAEDQHYLQRLLPGTLLQRPTTYNGEIALIRRIQAQLIDGIPYDTIQDRLNRQIEPKDLYSIGYGECYDRSRAIEKALTLAGFEVRHINLYSTQNTSVLAALTTLRQESHSVTEVKTSKGWLVVDSNFKWISIDKNNNPVGIRDVAAQFNNFKAPPYRIYKTFIPIIGLYSRHGRFYPPYNPFPDVNWVQLLANLTG